LERRDPFLLVLLLLLLSVIDYRFFRSTQFCFCIFWISNSVLNSRMRTASALRQNHQLEQWVSKLWFPAKKDAFGGCVFLVSFCWWETSETVVMQPCYDSLTESRTPDLELTAPPHIAHPEEYSP
jgi:hypothetical protein